MSNKALNTVRAMFGMVEEFNLVFDVEATADLQVALCVEESNEAREALANFLNDTTPYHMEKLIKEVCDLYYVIMGIELGRVNVEGFSEELINHAQDLAEVGATITLMAPLEEYLPAEQLLEAFTLVHESNMSKLDEFGNVLRREDGKVLKSDQYAEADLSDLAEAAMALYDNEVPQAA